MTFTIKLGRQKDMQTACRRAKEKACLIHNGEFEVVRVHGFGPFKDQHEVMYVID